MYSYLTNVILASL